jgi:hypothetical protein
MSFINCGNKNENANLNLLLIMKFLKREGLRTIKIRDFRGKVCGIYIYIYTHTPLKYFQRKIQRLKQSSQFLSHSASVNDKIVLSSY